MNNALSIGIVNINVNFINLSLFSEIQSGKRKMLSENFHVFPGENLPFQWLEVRADSRVNNLHNIHGVMKIGIKLQRPKTKDVSHLMFIQIVRRRILKMYNLNFFTYAINLLAIIQF